MAMTSKDSPKEKPATSSSTTRLSPSEIKSLQEDKRQATIRIKELLARRKAEAAKKGPAET
jgi:hypothetical protein